MGLIDIIDIIDDLSDLIDIAEIIVWIAKKRSRDQKGSDTSEKQQETESGK